MNILMPYTSKLTDLSHHCTIATIQLPLYLDKFFLKFTSLYDGIKRKGRHRTNSTVYYLSELFRLLILLLEFVASKRLFLNNPTMVEDSDSWHRPSWGGSRRMTAWSETMSLFCATIMTWRIDVSRIKASGMVFDQAVSHRSVPMKAVGSLRTPQPSWGY